MRKPLFTFAEHDNSFPDGVKAQELAEYRKKLDPVALDLLSRLLSQGVPPETAPRPIGNKRETRAPSVKHRQNTGKPSLRTVRVTVVTRSEHGNSTGKPSLVTAA